MKLLFFIFVLMAFLSCTSSNPKPDKENFIPSYSFSQEYKIYGKRK